MKYNPSFPLYFFAVTQFLLSFLISIVPYPLSPLKSSSIGLYQIIRHITIQIETSLLTVVITCKTLMKKGSASRNIGFFQHIASPLYQSRSFWLFILGKQCKNIFGVVAFLNFNQWHTKDQFILAIFVGVSICSSHKSLSGSPGFNLNTEILSYRKKRKPN